MICPRCKRDKAVDDFARDRSKASGRKSICKPCDAKKFRGYYAKNRERVSARVAARQREQRRRRNADQPTPTTQPTGAIQ